MLQFKHEKNISYYGIFPKLLQLSKMAVEPCSEYHDFPLQKKNMYFPQSFFLREGGMKKQIMLICNKAITSLHLIRVSKKVKINNHTKK